MSRETPRFDYCLNVAATYIGTSVLGPGVRSVVWVQGCPHQCEGCISPDWIPFRPARLVHVTELVSELLQDEAIDGFTFSGGEPFMQAQALAGLIRLARRERSLSLICYSGYTLKALQNLTSIPGVQDLLSETDVLIDGAFIPALNDNRGLRGSSNQHIHYLTGRHRDQDFETGPRKVEIIIQNGTLQMVGIPSIGIYHSVLKNTDKLIKSYEGEYERS